VHAVVRPTATALALAEVSLDDTFPCNARFCLFFIRCLASSVPSRKG
jgi:hypothetical protein